MNVMLNVMGIHRWNVVVMHGSMQQGGALARSTVDDDCGLTLVTAGARPLPSMVAQSKLAGHVEKLQSGKGSVSGHT